MPNNSYDVEARFTAYTITTSIDDLDAGEITEFDHLNKTAGETINLSIELADSFIKTNSKINKRNPNLTNNIIRGRYKWKR